MKVLIWSQLFDVGRVGGHRREERRVGTEFNTRIDPDERNSTCKLTPMPVFTVHVLLNISVGLRIKRRFLHIQNLTGGQHKRKIAGLLNSITTPYRIRPLARVHDVKKFGYNHHLRVCTCRASVHMQLRSTKGVVSKVFAASPPS